MHTSMKDSVSPAPILTMTINNLSHSKEQELRSIIQKFMRGVTREDLNECMSKTYSFHPRFRRPYEKTVYHGNEGSHRASAKQFPDLSGSQEPKGVENGKRKLSIEDLEWKMPEIGKKFRTNQPEQQGTYESGLRQLLHNPINPVKSLSWKLYNPETITLDDDETREQHKGHDLNQSLAISNDTTCSGSGSVNREEDVIEVSDKDQMDSPEVCEIGRSERSVPLPFGKSQSRDTLEFFSKAAMLFQNSLGMEISDPIEVEEQDQDEDEDCEEVEIIGHSKNPVEASIIDLESSDDNDEEIDSKSVLVIDEL